MPEGLAQLIAQMLEKDPAKRPATPAEVAALLAPFCIVGRISNPSVSSSTAPIQGADAPRSPQIAKSRPQRRIPPWLLIGEMLALVALGIVGLAATVFYFQTDNGTLRVEVQGRETEVRIQGTDIVVTAEGEPQPIKLSAGEHSLVVTRGDFRFETDKFELKRGETSVVKVELLPGQVKVMRDGEVIGRRPIDDSGPADEARIAPLAAAPAEQRAALQWALSHGGRLQLIVDNKARTFAAGDELPKVPFKVNVVNLSGTRAIDIDSIENLRAIPNVEWVLFLGEPVGNSVLEKVASYPGLSHASAVNFHGSSIGDEGLSHLKKFHRLNDVNLNVTNVTAKGVAQLAELNLTHVSLQDCPQVNDAAVDVLSQFAEAAIPVA